MTPPGLSTVSVSGPAWEARKEARAPRFYLDWERTREAQEQLDAAFTPAVSIVIGLNVALRLLLERPFRCEVLGMQVVGDNLRLRAEHRQIELEVGLERPVRELRIEIAEMR